MENSIEALVAQIVSELKTKPEATQPSADVFTTSDYPIMEKHGKEVVTPTGMNADKITLDAFKSGKVSSADLRISPEMLVRQAQIAKSAGKPQLGENFLRAAELVKIPDQTVIKMYDMLRPKRATKLQMEQMISELQDSYNAPLCAALVQEAANVYEKRGILLK